jgi:excinuclease ABC subunit C
MPTMDGLSRSIVPTAEPFRTFGRSAFAPHPETLGWLDLNRPRRLVRQELRNVCPDGAGVYGMLDGARQLIYVGTSRSLRRRLLTYFFQGASGGKEKRIASYARNVVWEPVGHAFLAPLRELELIRRWRPRFNVRGQPGRNRHGFLCLTRGQAPRFSVCMRLPKGCRRSWGPVATGRRTRAAVEMLNQAFYLPNCSSRVSMRFPEQRELFSQNHSPACLRGMLGTCLAPCAGRCTRAEYADRVQEACDFLDGRGADALVDRCEAEMLGAAECQEFERAARLRDQWEALSYLHEHMQRQRDLPPLRDRVYPLQLLSGEVFWYAIVGGQVVQALAAPRDATSAKHCLRLLQHGFGTVGPAPPARAEDPQQQQLVAAWFRRHTGELDQTMTAAQARQRCHRILRQNGDLPPGANPSRARGEGYLSIGQRISGALGG